MEYKLIRSLLEFQLLFITKPSPAVAGFASQNLSVTPAVNLESTALDCPFRWTLPVRKKKGFMAAGRPMSSKPVPRTVPWRGHPGAATRGSTK